MNIEIQPILTLNLFCTDFEYAFYYKVQRKLYE